MDVGLGAAGEFSGGLGLKETRRKKVAAHMISLNTVCTNKTEGWLLLVVIVYCYFLYTYCYTYHYYYTYYYTYYYYYYYFYYYRCR